MKQWPGRYEAVATKNETVIEIEAAMDEMSHERLTAVEWKCPLRGIKQYWRISRQEWKRDERDLTWKSRRMWMKQWPGRYEAVATKNETVIEIEAAMDEISHERLSVVEWNNISNAHWEEWNSIEEFIGRNESELMH